MNNSSESIKKYKENPFNNCSILLSLFNVGSHCSFYDWGSGLRVLLRLRAVTTIAYKIGTPFITNKFGTITFKIVPEPTVRETRSPPFMVTKLVLDRGLRSIPLSQSVPVFKKIAQSYGPFIKKLSIHCSLLKKMYFCGLNLKFDFNSFTAITHIELVPDCVFFDSFVDDGELIEYLELCLPNPQQVKVFNLAYGYGNKNSITHWTDLPKQIFKSFSSLQNLYYTGLIILKPVSGLGFLNRDPRIQLFECKSKKQCINCCKCFDNNYLLMDFDLANESHVKLFEDLIKDICTFATDVSIYSPLSDNLSLSKYLLNVKWTRTGKRFILDLGNFELNDLNVQVQPNLCRCVKI